MKVKKLIVIPMPNLSSKYLFLLHPHSVAAGAWNSVHEKKLLTYLALPKFHAKECIRSKSVSSTLTSPPSRFPKEMPTKTYSCC